VSCFTEGVSPPAAEYSDTPFLLSQKSCLNMENKNKFVSVSGIIESVVKADNFACNEKLSVVA